MYLLDFLIVIPILFFALRGIKNGLIGEVLGIIGLIAAVYLTFEYMDEVANLIHPLFGSEASYVIFVAALLIFIVTLLLVQLLDYFSSNFIRFVKLQSLNRTLGFFFGLLKGAIIMSALLLILSGFQIPSKQSQKSSITYSYIIYLAPIAYNTVSNKNFTQTIEDTLGDAADIFPITAD